MERTLFISEKVLEMKGYAYFETDDADTYSRYVEGMYDGMYVYQDDMCNVYLAKSAREEDLEDSDYDIEDIRNICYIDGRVDVFNMAEICARAGINYGTYKNWKSKGYKGMSNYNIQAIVDEMKKAVL